jgi:hypothetical protein
MNLIEAVAHHLQNEGEARLPSLEAQRASSLISTPLSPAPKNNDPIPGSCGTCS